MSKTWFTADTHLGHANIMKHWMRPFLSDQEKLAAHETPAGDWKISDDTVWGMTTGSAVADIWGVAHLDWWSLGLFCVLVRGRRGYVAGQ